MTVFQQYNFQPMLTPVRLCANTNVAGTYFNGNQNNGVGATLTIAASSLTVDSVVAAVADRILLQNQTSAFQNGIYVVNSIGATVVLQRAADQQSLEQYKEGQYVTVGAGSALNGSAFVLVEPLPAQLGINNLVWADSNASVDVVLPTIANHIATYTNTSGTIGEDAATAINGGNIQAGLSGTAGTLASFPATASKGSFVIAGVANTGNTITTLSNAAMGQASVISIPDPGAATANVLLDTGTGASATLTVANIVDLKYGATPVAQVDPASCTITAAAGAANTSTVTIQLKDGSGTNMARIIPFRVYASSTADGLTLQSAASTGFSVASGGLSLNNGAAITTQINCMASATGGCVLSLLDTGKQTSYLVLALSSGCKISAQLSSGSYG